MRTSVTCWSASSAAPGVGACANTWHRRISRCSHGCATPTMNATRFAARISISCKASPSPLGQGETAFRGKSKVSNQSIAARAWDGVRDWSAQEPTGPKGLRKGGNFVTVATKAAWHGAHTCHDDIRLPADGSGFAVPRADASFRAGGADGPARRGRPLPGVLRRPVVVVLQSTADAGHLHLRLRGDLQVTLGRADVR